VLVICIQIWLLRFGSNPPVINAQYVMLISAVKSIVVFCRAAGIKRSAGVELLF